MRYDFLKANIDSLTYNELISQIAKLGLQFAPGFHILKGTKINRARPTKGDCFNNIKQLSYNPWPVSFGRASTPCYPMFYGTTPTNDFDNALVTNFAELNEIIKNLSGDSDEQEISIGEFVLKEDIDAIGLIFCEEFLKKNSQYLPLYESFKKNSSDLQNNDFEIVTYFSEMFSYSQKDVNFDYRITSGIANFLLETQQRFGAILYPSVRLGGEGTNIAIKPNIVNSMLECKRVFTTKIYIKNKCCYNDLINVSESFESDGSFKLIDLPPPFNQGREKCLEILEGMINEK